jgi:co-chaperonin GroES (HSP10)
MIPTNTSGLEPEGHAVLLRMYEAHADLKSNMIEIPESVRKAASVMENRAEVIAVGAMCWFDEKKPRAAPGDRVIVTRMAGYTAAGPADGKLYRLVNDRDIFCRITKESQDG